MPSLGQQLKALRTKKGMTQEQLAAKLKTTKAAISRYERDQRQPRIEQITEIAMILDASPDELYHLFLGAQEFNDDCGEYATRMNAMTYWVETITGANGIIDAADSHTENHNVDGENPTAFTPGESLQDSRFVVKKSVPGNKEKIDLTISIDSDGMQLKDLILFFEYLKNQNLAGDGILELMDFVRAAHNSAKNNIE